MWSIHFSTNLSLDSATGPRHTDSWESMWAGCGSKLRPTGAHFHLAGLGVHGHAGAGCAEACRRCGWVMSTHPKLHPVFHQNLPLFFLLGTGLNSSAFVAHAVLLVLVCLFEGVRASKRLELKLRSAGGQAGSAPGAAPSSWPGRRSLSRSQQVTLRLAEGIHTNQTWIVPLLGMQGNLFYFSHLSALSYFLDLSPQATVVPLSISPGLYFSFVCSLTLFSYTVDMGEIIPYLSFSF